MRFVLAVNASRQDGYQDLMDEKNTTLLPVSKDIPQIEVVIDEGAELLSARTFGDPVMKDLQAKVKKAMRTTRAMGIRLILTAVDGNVSAIGDTEVRKFAPVGAALTSGENVTSNTGKLFKNAKVDTGQLNEKGAGVIGQSGADGFDPTPFKGWKTSPNMVRDCVLATNHLRPTLDEVSAQADGADIYAQRWSPERAGWLWGAAEYRDPEVSFDAEGDDTASTTPASSPRRAVDTGEGGLNLSYKRRDQQRQAPLGKDHDALAAEFRREIDERFETTEEPNTNQPSGLNLSYKRDDRPTSNTPDTETGIDPRRALVRKLVQDAGNTGVDTSEIWDALNAHFGDRWDRAVVTTWLSDDVRADRMHRPRKGRYVHGPQPSAE
jgi:hypothetical protein